MMKFLEDHEAVRQIVLKHGNTTKDGLQGFGFSVGSNYIYFRIRDDDTVWVSFDATVCGKPHRVSEDVLHSSEFWLEILHKHLEEA